MTRGRIDKIRARLNEALEPQELEIIDESHLHKGHEGAKDGRGHFRVRIVASKFHGKTAIQRHRMVYAAVGDLMESDIHALSVEARATP